MCGRFAITQPSDTVAQVFEARPANDLPHVPNYNVCPSDNIHVIYRDDEVRKLGMMRWGFTPSWYKTLNDGPLLINARAETIADKPAFKGACRTRRCIIPMSGFFEWERSSQQKLPWYIEPNASAGMGKMFAFAGIWQDWSAPNDLASEQMQTCAMITTEANESMGKIHHRMPVALAQKDWGLWLGEEGRGAAPLMRPAAEDVMTFQRVGTEVNSSRAAGPQLIEPF
jgi:putative SOS response-associated peptidase YedK